MFGWVEFEAFVFSTSLSLFTARWSSKLMESGWWKRTAWRRSSNLPYLCCICQDHTHKLDYTALLSPYSHSRIAFLSRLVPKLIRGKPSRLYKWPWLQSQVQLDSQMLDDLAIDTTLLRSKITDPLNLYELIRGLVLTRFLFRDVKDRRKRLVGKLWSGEGSILDFGEYTFYRNKSLNLADDATCVTELGNLVTAVSCT